jgi:3,4-dihydroxy 2-butanone 4-phosphate synthase/GTP cyclohydrolase II
VRAGHTEAAVDVSRLAGLNPSGVICEIMNDDGTMARMPDLMIFAQEHGLKIATIADLIAYRRRTEKLVELVATSKINSRFGGAFDVRVYANKVTYAEHLAIVRGDVTGDEPVYVRVHQHNLLADSLGDETASVFFRGEARSRAGELEAALEFIAKKDRGVVVVIREPTQTTLSRFIKERQGQPMSTPMADLRQYGIGAQILQDLGIRNMVLLSNSEHKVVGLEGYGIHLKGQQPFGRDKA